MNLKIHANMNRFGHVTLVIVNKKWRKRIIDRANENGGSFRPDESIYLQSDYAIEEIRGRLSKRTLKNLDGGWTVSFRMDGWEAAHYYGYDAHTVFEGGKR